MGHRPAGRQHLPDFDRAVPAAGAVFWLVRHAHAADQSRDVDVLQGQKLLAEYRVHRFHYGLDFGRQFGNWGEIRSGVQREQGHFRLKVGDPSDPNLPQQSFASFNTRDYFVRFTYDRLDDINFPHRGQQATLQWSGVRNATGAEQTSIR